MSIKDANPAIRTGAVTTDKDAAMRRRTPRWLVPFVATLGGLVVWALGMMAGVGEVVVDTGAAMQQVTIVSVAVASLVVSFAGWAVRALIGKVTGSAARAGVVWLVLSGIVLLASFMGVMGATTTGALVVLLAEHLVVGLVLMVGLRR
jgi:hypothetical protein